MSAGAAVAATGAGEDGKQRDHVRRSGVEGGTAAAWSQTAPPRLLQAHCSRWPWTHAGKSSRPCCSCTLRGTQLQNADLKALLCLLPVGSLVRGTADTCRGWPPSLAVQPRRQSAVECSMGWRPPGTAAARRGPPYRRPHAASCPGRSPAKAMAKRAGGGGGTGEASGENGRRAVSSSTSSSSKSGSGSRH